MSQKPRPPTTFRSLCGCRPTQPGLATRIALGPPQPAVTSPGPCCAGCGPSCCLRPPARTRSRPRATRRSSGRWTAMGTAWWTSESCSRGCRAWASHWARTPRRWVARGAGEAAGAPGPSLVPGGLWPEARQGGGTMPASGWKSSGELNLEGGGYFSR